MLDERTCRVILGVENDDGHDLIKHAYKTLLRKYHPDTAAVPNRYLLEKVMQAYKLLSIKKTEFSRLSAKKYKKEASDSNSYSKNNFRGRKSSFTDSQTKTTLKDFDEIFISGQKSWDKLIAVSRLVSSGRKSSYFYLRQALHDKDKKVVHASIKAIGQLRIFQSASEFTALFRNSDLETRREILSAVNQIGVCGPFDDIIKAGLHDRDFNVRMQTLSIYKNMLLKRNEK